MDAQQALVYLANVKSLSYATVDDSGAPQVRIIDTVLHNGKLHFVTARGKEFYDQLTSDKRVGIVGLTKDWKMIRLSARAEKTGRDFVDLIFQMNPGMNDIYPADSRRILEAFCIVSGHGEVFDLSDTPICRESFSFGGAAIEHKGFIINDDCIACGACASGCPQQCIDEGTVYSIRQKNCLHCGRCTEVCPIDAVKCIGK